MILGGHMMIVGVLGYLFQQRRTFLVDFWPEYVGTNRSYIVLQHSSPSNFNKRTIVYCTFQNALDPCNFEHCLRPIIKTFSYLLQ